MSCLAALRRLCVAALACTAAVGQQRTVFVVPVPATPGWQDLAALPTVAAAAAASTAAPLVVAVDPAAPWRPELRAFLARLSCDELVWVGATVPPGVPDGLTATATGGDSLTKVACALARRSFTKTRTAVLCTFEDRGAALSAAVLAGRLRAPLLPIGDDGLDPSVRATLAALGTRELLVVGAGDPGDVADATTERLDDGFAVARAMRKRKLATEWLAIVQPDDATAPHARNLSIVAALLAVGRNGAVLPWSGATVWKRPVPTRGAPPSPPPGVDDGATALRVGSLDVDGVAREFVTGRGHGRGPWVRIDLDGDGRFDGAGEGPWKTGDVATLGARPFALDLDADEHARGDTLWLTTPTVDEVRAALTRFTDALGHVPDALCIVGWPDTFPLAIVSDGQGTDADLVSDLPFAQLDADPFVDVGFARFVAEDVAAGTLLAARGLAYDRFADRSFAKRFATAEWEVTAQTSLAAAGLEHVGHHAGDRPIGPDSPVTGAGFVVHGSHAMWTTLGSTYTWDSDVLLAPCVVESSGCSTAALDMDTAHRSVAARMLRNGAVAFIGNARRGTARQELFRSELWNGLFRGLPLGAANRAALNRLIVAGLDTGEVGHGLRHYQLYCATVFGDPALDVHLPSIDGALTARVDVSGQRAVVHAPRSYLRTDYAPLAEWGCARPKLTTWRAPMVGAESVWFGPDKRNADELWFTAEVATKKRFTGVTQVGNVPDQLGWSGHAYVDEHFDGSRSVLWRTRLIDFDMMEGAIRTQVERVTFRLQKQ